MPGMFSRRRGSSANPPVDRNTHTSAAVAASQAFTGQPLPKAGLSSAAAAAALRSHTTSPELVGNVQTKRMIRRNSNSSNGSGSVAGNGIRNGRAPLQRTNSGGSMSERSFRSPSPGKPNGTTSAVTAGPDAPPVPPLPAKAQAQHQRSASMEPPQRVLSPTPAAGQRYASVDRASMPPPGSSAKAKRLSNVVEGDEAERARNTKNFSRPMSPQQGSPATATKRYTHGTGSWFTQVAGDSPQAQAIPANGARQSAILQQSAAPLASTAMKKNRISSAPGSHLAQANHTWNRDHSSTRSASSGAPESATVYDPNSRTFVQAPSAQQPADPPSPDSPKRNEVYDPHTRSFVPRSQADRDDAGSQIDSSPVPIQAKKTRPVIAPVNTSLEPPPRNPARVSPSSTPPTSPRAAGILGKQPSVVREDPDAEQEAETSGTWRKDYRSTVPATETSAGPPTAYKAPATAPHQRSASLDVPRADDSIGRGRVPSQSPQRSARFSPSPILQPERHVPPPRDVSPAKSAMKHSPSTSQTPTSRTAGFALPPAAGMGYAASEASEDGGSQDGFGSIKKKGARVSFDDQPIQIAQAPAQPLSPPIDEDEDDAFMKPRPMLPSFGSVRKGRVEPEVPEKVTEMPPERNEASSDHAIGGILRNHNQSLPLPPEVTSKDSAGYASDESSEAEVPAVSAAAQPARAEAGQYAPAQIGETNVKDFADYAEPALHPGLEDLEVPDINLLPPTPGIEEDTQKELAREDATQKEAVQKELPQEEITSKKPVQEEPVQAVVDNNKLTPQKEDADAIKKMNRNSMEGISVPGGWALEDEPDEPTTTEERTVEPTPSSTAGRRPSAEDSLATQTITPIQMPAQQQDLSDIDEDSDGAEFSDAVEDPEDLEDGGFASLNAIVHSPVVTNPPVETKTEAAEVAESPITKQTGKQVQIAEDDAPPTGDWGQATAYWSQLSKERRQQIEREHFSSDDEASPPPAVTKKSRVQQQGVTPAMKPALKQPTQSAMRKSMRGPPEPVSAPAPAPAREGVQMRSSMRSGGGGGGGMATSLRSGPQPRRPQSEYIEPRGTLQKKNIRPMSAGGASTSSYTAPPIPSQQSPGAKNQDSSFPALPRNQSSEQPRRSNEPQVSERLQRELSKADDSDSESSFRKRRRAGSVATTDSTGRYNMKRSMRGQSVDQRPAPAERRPTSPETTRQGKSSFSIRSLSPTGSFFGRNKGGGKASRSQPPASGPRTTLRGPPAPQSKSRSTPAAARPAPAAPAQSRFKSRFNDSDDEDEDRRSKPTHYRSRFADSDDEDEPSSPRIMRADLAPVRGIPRRQGQDDGDSTDLDDEDDEDDPRKASRKRDKMATPMVPAPGDVEKAMAAARRNLGMTNRPAAAATSPKNEGGALSKGSLRDPAPPEQPEPKSKPEDISSAPPDKKKKGFMGSILRRNRNSSSSVQQLSQVNSAQTAASPAAVASPSSPQAKEMETPSSPSSPSVGKLVRRQSDQPRMMRTVSEMSGTTSPPAAGSESPKITRKASENWPLPPPIPDEDESRPELGRPNTSDGNLAETLRPDLGPRSKSGQPLNKRVSIQAGEEGSEPGEREGRAVYSMRTGKKKKFGALRRAFRLDD